MTKEKILVTGGCGYIGSQTCVDLIEQGYEVVVVDSLVNSSTKSLDRIEEITGVKPLLYVTDLRDYDRLCVVFQEHTFDAVIHFAGLKAVGESSEIPLEYYSNNLTGSINLLRLMSQFSCKKLVFSSSATVYGLSRNPPNKEEHTVSAYNPYGRSKLFIENIVQDVCAADPEWRAIILRYFNPVGAHPSGRLGEDPKGIPNNLMPYLAKVALGQLPLLHVYGNDYKTSDGTGLRDYIHVVDLSQAHIVALENGLFASSITQMPVNELERSANCRIYNIGTGIGQTVLEMIHAFEKVLGRKLDYKIVGRRPGDVDILLADPSKAKRELNYTSKKTLEEMCKDLWRWTTANPNGYDD